MKLSFPPHKIYYACLLAIVTNFAHAADIKTNTPSLNKSKATSLAVNPGDDGGDDGGGDGGGGGTGGTNSGQCSSNAPYPCGTVVYQTQLEHDVVFETLNYEEARKNGILYGKNVWIGWRPISQTPGPGLKPIYRCYDSNSPAGQYHFAADRSNCFGYKNEGIYGYVFATQQPGTQAMESWYTSNTGINIYFWKKARSTAVVVAPNTIFQLAGCVYHSTLPICQSTKQGYYQTGVLGYVYPSAK
jgi:hypothetical protein